MSSRRPTDELVHDLAAEISPVRPIASLRAVLAITASIWVAAVVVNWLLGSPLPHPSWEVHLGAPDRAGVLFGLALAAAGGVLAALAGAVPGREGVVRSGAATGLVGVGVALGCALWGTTTTGRGPAASIATDLACLLRAVAIALPPVYVISAYLARGAALQQRTSAGLAAVGAVGLGALAVHLSCPMLHGDHVFVSHALAPLLVAGVLSLPLAAWLVARQRGSSPAPS